MSEGTNKRAHYLVLTAKYWFIAYLACMDERDGNDVTLRPAWFNRENDGWLCNAGDEMAIAPLPAGDA